MDGERSALSVEKRVVGTCRKRVSLGDTSRTGGMPVRLIGLATPERPQMELSGGMEIQERAACPVHVLDVVGAVLQVVHAKSWRGPDCPSDSERFGVRKAYLMRTARAAKSAPRSRADRGRSGCADATMDCAATSKIHDLGSPTA